MLIGLAALTLGLASCEPKEKIDWGKVTVNGFYVAGPATGSDEIKPECVMAAGFNEVDKAVRDGMYEKYIVLEANKEFYLLYNDGTSKVKYSASLENFPTPEEEAYADNPASVLKGKLVKDNNAPAMKVSKTGLYHIVLDINKAGDLGKDYENGVIVLLDASDFGVRGGMNGWGFTPATAKTEFSNEGTTFTFKDQELGKAGEFKFATGNYWKVTLDDAGKVKAEVSLAEGMTLNGANIKVDKGGTYDITLTFKLAQGSFDKCFSYTADCTKESSAPETMYMIGAQWGNWSWDDAGVVDLVPVWGAPGYFWVTRYFQAGGEFKFCAQKAWNGDFGDNGNNIKIDEAGFYTIFVNGNDNKFEIKPAEVYVIGLCGTPKTADQDVWDFGGADVLKFAPDGEVLKATLASNAELRLASKVHPAAAIEGVTTGNGWIDWWKTEFIFFDGKIAYRGAGNDQDRVQGEAGKVVTIDFNNGTVTMEADNFVPAIKVDGDMSDWANITTKVTSTKDTPVYAEFKVTNDSKNIYFYGKRDNRDAIWNRGGYIYFDIDADNNPATGVAKEIEGLEMWLYFFPFDAKGTIADDIGSGSAYPSKDVFNNFKFKGAVSDSWVEIEASLPLSDAGVKQGDVIAVYTWSNKSGDDLKKTPITYTVL